MQRGNNSLTSLPAPRGCRHLIPRQSTPEGLYHPGVRVRGWFSNVTHAMYSLRLPAATVFGPTNTTCWRGELHFKAMQATWGSGADGPDPSLSLPTHPRKGQRLLFGKGGLFFVNTCILFFSLSLLTLS